jgi:polyhydroxyalkanoate synthesis repressor PhaR
MRIHDSGFANTPHCVILKSVPEEGHWHWHEPEYPGGASTNNAQAQARIPMSDSRVIKKYPNRRLYDTVESRYITLADVRRLVVERLDFVVVDKKNNADITRSILLQVIAEQEHIAEPILTQEFMLNVIRSYGTSAQPSVSGHLEQTLRHFISQQPPSPAIRERVKPFVGVRPPDESYKSLSPLREASTFTK